MRFITILFIFMVAYATAFADQGVTSSPLKLQLNSAEIGWLSQHKSITVGGPISFPPFHFFDQNGELKGISADYLYLIMKPLGVTVHVKRKLMWSEVLIAAQKGEIDLIPCIAKTADRESYLHFSRPYLSFPLVIISRQNAPFIGGIEDLQGKKVALVRKIATDEWLTKDGIRFVPYYVDNLLKGLEAVSYEQADACVQNLASASYLMLNHGMNNLKIAAPTPYGNYNLYMAVPKQLPELLSIVNKALAAIPPKIDTRIRNKWLSVRYEYGISRMDIVKWVLIVTFCALLVFCVIFIWNRKLTQENRERRIAEEALRQERDRAQKYLDIAGVIFVALDINGDITLINQKGCKTLEYEPDELLGRNWFTTVMPSTAQAPAKLAFQELMRSETNGFGYLENIILTQKGDERIIAWYNTILKNSEGRLIGSLSSGEDITERKHAEEDLARERAFTDTALDTQLDIFFLYEPATGKALRWNQAFQTISGYEDSEIAQLPAPDSYHDPDDLQRVKLFNQKVLKEGTGTIELELICKHGQKVPIEYRVSSLKNEQGSSQYLIATGRDVTVRNKLNEQLRQTQKMEAIGTLAGGIAHDFNNMLSVIIGNISYALTQINHTEELFKVLSDIQDGAKQAQSLTQQLLTFAKGGEPVRKIADINRLAKESANFVIRGAKSKCTFELADDIWSTEIDEGQIGQVVGNIVINANQAMPLGGIIGIRSENYMVSEEDQLPLADGRYVRIAIEDQGFGISQKHLSQIFDAYYTTKQEGTGLGLATAYAIIKKHGGHIVVQSVIDKGSTFQIYLPASTKPYERRLNDQEIEHKGHGKILIMDDEEPILNMTARILSQMGYETATSTDGAQAIVLYQKAFQAQKPFDLVILDLTVPGGVGGAQTMLELLEINPHVKAIVSSGYSNDPIMANYQDYGFQGVVPKPYTKAHLADLLNRIFDRN